MTADIWLGAEVNYLCWCFILVENKDIRGGWENTLGAFDSEMGYWWIDTHTETFMEKF